MNVANQRVATVFDSFDSLLGSVAKQLYDFARISDLVDADVDHRGAAFDVISTNESRPSNRGDQNICLARHACQVSRARMTNGDSRVSLQQ